MIRLLAALAAALLLAPAAQAQEKQPQDKQPQEKPAKDKADKKEPALEIDARTAAAIRAAVEKAKDEIRDEVRAELQGAQSAAEFLGAVAEGPKLEFFELDGYMRFRGQLYDQLDLGAGTDASGYFLFPKPLINPTSRATLASANMRLRLEPTLNVSENVRVRAQVDVLDNYVLGSSTSTAFDGTFSPYPVPFYGSSRVGYQFDAHNDRAAIIPKRAWGEVQTPVGLLSFGRMPSSWGLGILANAGSGLDEDFGDTVDRVQFALPPVATPLGSLTFVPMLDFDAEGALTADPHAGSGVGQPFDLDSADDARTYAIKAMRLDTDDEIRRKLERGESSLNFGAYYNYRTQRNVFPNWLDQGYIANLKRDGSELFAHRRAYGHVLDVWTRFLLPRWRFELEGTWAYGSVGNAFVVGHDGTVDKTPVVKSLGAVLIRQWGAVLQTEFKAIPNKVSLGLELGVASGDDAPGFGNLPGRGPGDNDPCTIDSTTGEPSCTYQPYGSVEGPQFGTFTNLHGVGTHDDRTIRNFRFNPAYRVDQVLWRNILGQVTDAWYLKPSLHWNMLPGLALDLGVVYSNAMKSQSTPSAAQAGTTVDVVTVTDQGNGPLGLELDTQVTYTSGDGFGAWMSWGILEPLDGLGTSLKRGYALSLGLAAKF
jgi:uncharacterized protein (TIGR04551 family)